MLNLLIEVSVCGLSPSRTPPNKSEGPPPPDFFFCPKNAPPVTFLLVNSQTPHFTVIITARSPAIMGPSTEESPSSSDVDCNSRTKQRPWRCLSPSLIRQRLPLSAGFLFWAKKKRPEGRFLALIRVAYLAILRCHKMLLVSSQLSTVPVSKPSAGSITRAYISSSCSTASKASVS